MKLNKLTENINRIKSLMSLNETSDVDIDNINKGEVTQDPVQVQGDDGMDDDSDDELKQEEVTEQEAGSTETTTQTSSTDTETETSSTGYPTVTKWESKRTFGKTYMNDPKYKWESGRGLGPTYKGPNAKWESGTTVGKGNPRN
jgi:hypothetical protein